MPSKQNIQQLPWLLGIRESAQIVGLSEKTFRRLVTEGMTPKFDRIGGRLLKCRRSHLEMWVEYGMPSRERFEAILGSQNGGQRS